MKYTLIDRSKIEYKFAQPHHIREALERYKVAETDTNPLGFFGAGIPFTGKKIRYEDLQVLEPFLNAFCDYTMRLGNFEIGPVQTGAFSEVCGLNDEYALVQVPRETIFILAVECYLTWCEAVETVEGKK